MKAVTPVLHAQVEVQVLQITATHIVETYDFLKLKHNDSPRSDKGCHLGASSFSVFLLIQFLISISSQCSPGSTRVCVA